VIASSDATVRALADGARLFDAGRFFDAHEVWEDAWRLETGSARELLHGLIQIAAGLHKGLVQRRPSRMARQLAKGLARVEASTGKQELEAFCEAVGAWIEAARRWAEVGEPPQLAPPRIRVTRRGAAPPRSAPRG
jgi:predicted metal-dependent hydrolase